MAHYFSKENDLLESKKKDIHFIINKNHYHMTSDSGVFSKSGLDFGTRTLLETILPTPYKKVLDLGCGYGPIGIVLGKVWHCSLTMVDINVRAVELAQENVKNHFLNAKVLQSDGFENVNDTFDLIVSNPPIRVGKKIIYQFFEDALTYLNEKGSLILVINKNQGALSAIKECEKHYALVEVLAKQSGYYVIKCQK
ncbi:MAG: methyltransferase [Firmicutes bacterium]|nr:methyltransferase [Bacillota bacterium]